MNKYTDITIEENSTRKIVYFKPDTFLRIHLKENSKLYLWNIYLTKNHEKHNCEVILEGENAFAQNQTVYFGSNKALLDISTKHIHYAKNGISIIEVHGISSGKSYVKYDGTIEVSKKAVNSDVKLNGKTLLLGKHAKANIIPQLKIATNDVKASHSAAISTIDDEELFYSACRGIGKNEANTLLASSFLKLLLKDIPDRIIVKRAKKLIKQFLCN